MCVIGEILNSHTAVVGDWIHERGKGKWEQEREERENEGNKKESIKEKKRPFLLCFRKRSLSDSAMAEHYYMCWGGNSCIEFLNIILRVTVISDGHSLRH